MNKWKQKIYIGYRRNDNVDMVGYKGKGNSTHAMYECVYFHFFPEIFYDKTLPSQFDESRVKMSSRKYVSNSKYGNIYKIQ